MRHPALQLPAAALSVGAHRASGYPGLLKHRSRLSLPSTQPRTSSKPPPLPNSQVYSMYFGGVGYFYFYSSPHFTPVSLAWGLGLSWQKLKFRREHTQQTGLPSLTKQTKLKAIPTLQASHPKDNINRNSLASNSKQDWKECDLAFLSRSVNLPWGQIPHKHGLYYQGTERAIEEAPTPDKKVS